MEHIIQFEESLLDSDTFIIEKVVARKIYKRGFQYLISGVVIPMPPILGF